MRVGAEMKFTDLFIQRPVLAMVVSLAILIAGFLSARLLPTQQFPQTEYAVITVTTAYSGADPELVAGFITSPLESEIAQANGIDYVTSSSRSGSSVISAKLRLNYDPNRALTEISAKINSALDRLPLGTQPPVIAMQAGGAGPSMYIGFFSDVLSLSQITDYLVRVVQPRFQGIPGVQASELLGARNFALRIWLNPESLAAYDLTPRDVTNALAANNFITGIGSTKNTTVQVVLSAATGLSSVNEFEDIVIKRTNGAFVRVRDVAKVTLGSDNYEARETHNGKAAVFIGVSVAPTANLLDVMKNVRQTFVDMKPRFPPSLKGEIDYDASKFVESAIAEVKSALLESAVIVTLVVFMFLGSLRSAIIPTITIPLSLIGTFAMMLMLGFSINLLTLLGLVLAIGLVVDDAIIVVENVNRRLDDGFGLKEAALKTGRELGGPIFAMTIVLAAVYVPIGFEGGLTGALFTEFAFTLVGAVTVSAIVALSLSPVMCAWLLKRRARDSTVRTNRLAIAIESLFAVAQRRYLRWLRNSLDHLSVVGVFVALTSLGAYLLYANAESELAPAEDQGMVLNIATVQPNMTLEQKEIYQREIFRRLAKYPETESVFQINSPGTALSGMVLKPWAQRTRTAQELEPAVQRELGQIPDVRVATFQLPSLPGSGGLPINFVLGTAKPFSELNDIAKKFTKEASLSGIFAFIDDDLDINYPGATLEIDRNKMAALGLDMSQVGGTLSTLLSGGYIGYFDLYDRPYKVIPQVQQRYRLNSHQLLDYYISASDGTSVPLSTVARIRDTVMPESIQHFQLLNAATIQGVLAQGVELGEALQYLNGLAARMLPSGYSVDYAGSSRQFVNESAGFLQRFGLAAVIIFLCLAALFESFKDPIVILVSVPISIAGALIFVNLGVGGATLNIYTQIGLVTLMGLISKHGILIVQFANDLQAQGRTRREAIEQAAAVRLRPILMTSAAMVLGVIPLILATGAGAVARFNIGLVIASGVSIGTLFTLFVVPAVYLSIASDHQVSLTDEIH